MNLTIIRSPANEIAVKLLSFLDVQILDTINMILLFFQFVPKMAIDAVRTKKKRVK